MKAKFIILFFPLLLLLTTTLFAQKMSKVPYEDIYLEDGSIYHGYLAEQNVTTGDVTIHYLWADYTFDEDKVMMAEYDDQPVTSLIADGKTYSDVCILEHGDIIKFRVLKEGDYQIKSTEIVRTVRPVYDGILDLISLRSGKQYVGHIVETIPGKSLKLKTDNGKVINLLTKNISIQQRECKNKEKYNIVMQSPFSEEYVMRDGGVFKGVLVAQINESGLLTLSDNKGNPVSFSLSDIAIIKKAARPDFTVVDPELGEKEVRVNGILYTGMTSSVNKNIVMIPAEQHLPFILVAPGKVVVEVDSDLVSNADPNNSPYSLFEFNPSKDDNDYYKLDPVKSAARGRGIAPDTYEKGTTTTKYTYNHLAPGIYAMINITLKNLFLIWVN